MSAPTFSQFRTGTPLTLGTSTQVSYAELKNAGLQDYYIRVVHDLGVQGKLERPQVEAWIKRLTARDRLDSQAVRAELEARRAAALGLEPHAQPGTQAKNPSKTPSKTPSKSRTRPERVVLLVSRGDHKQALKVAEKYGLHAVPVSPQALRPGQSPEAHTVRATESVASKLITTGNWKSSD